MKLVRGNPLFAAGNEEDRLQPDVHLDMAGLEDGPDLHGEGLAAVVALVDADPGALALHLAILLHPATVRAYRTARPDAGFHEGVGGFLVVEVRGGKDGFVHGAPLVPF